MSFSVLILFLGGLVFALTDAGIVPEENIPSNPLLLGSIAEFGVFSLAGVIPPAFFLYNAL